MNKTRLRIFAGVCLGLSAFITYQIVTNNFMQASNGKVVDVFLSIGAFFASIGLVLVAIILYIKADRA
jgi:hypothetical protein